MASKIEQNFLSKNSTGEMMYICGKCYTEVSKDAEVCPKCGAKLGKIKCPFCQFTGGVNDFKNDTCPKCGRKNLKEPLVSSDRSYSRTTSYKGSRKSREDGTYVHIDPLKNRFLIFFLPLFFLVLFLIFVFLRYFEIF